MDKQAGMFWKKVERTDVGKKELTEVVMQGRTKGVTVE